MHHLLTGRYLNLDRCPDRDAFMREQLARLGLGWVGRQPALDGAQLAAPAGCPLLPGEYACFLTHLQALESAPEGGFTLVLEDDTELSDQLPGILGKALAGDLDGADVVFLECQTYFTLPHLTALWEAASRHLVDTSADGTQRMATGVDLLDARSFYRWGCGSYLVTPRGRPRMLALMRAWLQAGPPLPLDRCLEQAFAAGQLKGSLTVPFLATTALRWHGRSTIGNGERVPHDVFMVARRLLYAGGLGGAQTMFTGFTQAAADPALHLFGLVLRDAAGGLREALRTQQAKPAA